MLGSVGGTAASYAAWSLVAPGPFSWGALGLAGVAGLAYASNCQLDTGAGSSLPPSYTAGCQRITGGVGELMVDFGAGPVWIGPGAPDSQLVTEIVGVTVNCTSGCLMQVRYITTRGARTFTETRPKLSDFAAWKWSLRPLSGSCAEDQPPDAPAPVPPYKYTDPDDGCEINVTFQGWVVGPGGTTGAAWKMEPAAQPLASGGVIGGCNFAPVLYYQPPGGGGGGDGPPPIPWNPGPDGDGGEPWWMQPLRDLADALTEATIQRIVDGVFGAKAAAVTYRLVSVCETDAQGEAISQSREVSIPQLPILEGLVARVDAMDDLMQGLKDFRQPVCRGPRPQGQLVTARFRSSAPSPNSSRALRKELRYRDNANRPEAEHVSHWLPFEWQSGPAIVTSRGAAWGVVQVWAADPAEGRRVIEHAAAIAGVDLAVPGHAWEDATARGSRYGQPGLMRVEHDEDGTPCISKRIGPSGTPSWMRDP